MQQIEVRLYVSLLGFSLFFSRADNAPVSKQNENPSIEAKNK